MRFLLTCAFTNVGFVPRLLIADKAYDSGKDRRHIDFWMDSEVIIKPIKRTKLVCVCEEGFTLLYDMRTSVERFFSRPEALNLRSRFRVFGMRTVQKLIRLTGVGFPPRTSGGPSAQEEAPLKLQTIVQ